MPKVHPDTVYNVEAVWNHKGTSPHRQFLIKWENYTASDNTWEPEEDVCHVDVVQKYLLDRHLSAPVDPWFEKERKRQEGERKVELLQKKRVEEERLREEKGRREELEESRRDVRASSSEEKRAVVSANNVPREESPEIPMRRPLEKRLSVSSLPAASSTVTSPTTSSALSVAPSPATVAELPALSLHSPPRCCSVLSDVSFEIPETLKRTKVLPACRSSRDVSPEIPRALQRADMVSASSAFHEEQASDEEDSEGAEKVMYSVSKVRKMKGEEPDRLFYVHWDGYESEDDTWEPESGVGHLDIIQEFITERKAKEKRKRKLSQPEDNVKTEKEKSSCTNDDAKTFWSSDFKIPKKKNDAKSTEVSGAVEEGIEEVYGDVASNEQILRAGLNDDLTMIKLTLGQVENEQESKLERNQTLLPNVDIGISRSSDGNRFDDLYQRLKYLRGETVRKRFDTEVPRATSPRPLFETAMEELAERNWTRAADRMPEVIGDYVEYWKNELLKNHTRAMLSTDPQKMLRDEPTEVPRYFRKLLKDPDVRMHRDRDEINHAKDEGRVQAQCCMKQVVRPVRVRNRRRRGSQHR